ncbi:MAG: hypothetical protein J6X18_08410 [Bacteroidales bacterium]|nr:hypothetical protein [Bacteroidales bacterium]
MGKAIEELYKKTVDGLGQRLRSVTTEEEFMVAVEKDYPELADYRKTKQQAEFLEGLEHMLQAANPRWTRSDTKKSDPWWLFAVNKSGKEITAQEIYDYFSNLINEYNIYRKRCGE